MRQDILRHFYSNRWIFRGCDVQACVLVSGRR